MTSSREEDDDDDDEEDDGFEERLLVVFLSSGREDDDLLDDREEVFVTGSAGATFVVFAGVGAGTGAGLDRTAGKGVTGSSSSSRIEILGAPDAPDVGLMLRGKFWVIFDPCQGCTVRVFSLVRSDSGPKVFKLLRLFGNTKPDEEADGSSSVSARIVSAGALIWLLSERMPKAATDSHASIGSELVRSARALRPRETGAGPDTSRGRSGALEGSPEEDPGRGSW